MTTTSPLPWQQARPTPAPPPHPDTLAAALAYAQRGWRVLPLRPRSKVPLLTGWPDEATTDPEVIRGWWRDNPRAGVGIATGRGLLVLDVDAKGEVDGYTTLAALVQKHGGLPCTYTVHTPTGGAHYYFRTDANLRNTAGDLGPGLDTRANGGQVVAPPTVVGAGPYMVAQEGEVAPAPAWLLDLLKAPKKQARIDGAIPQGNRNDRLYREACRLRRAGADADAILVALREIPTDPPLTDAELRDITANACKHDPEPAAQAHDACTHLANAHRIAGTWGDQLMYVEGIGWHCWGPPWRLDEGGAYRLVYGLGKMIAEEAAALAPWVAQASDSDERNRRQAAMDRRFRWAGHSESRGTIEASLALAAPLLSCKAIELDANSDLLGLPGGVLDLRTCDVREHRQEDRITKTTGCDMLPAASAPTWRRFIAEVLGGDAELIDFLHRLAGYMLSGHRGQHLLPIAWGSGANGKSTLLGTLQAMLGEYASTAAPGLLMAKHGNDHPTGLADLQGRRLVVASESGEAGRLNEELVKALTGGDKITARRMRMDFYTFDPSHLLVLQTNHRPRVSGTDEGIWRRLRLIPFTVTIPPEKRDPELPRKLKAELPGILAWALEGWRMYRRDGFNDPAAVRAATTEYRDSSDLVGAFISECCELGAYFTATAKELYAEYVDWCKTNGEHPRSQREFGLRLGERGLERFRSNTGHRWRGIRLSEDQAHGFRRAS